MSNPRPSLSLKVENFVSGIIRFVNRYARTGMLAIFWPRSFNQGLGRSIRNKRIVPPLTFLIIGCFLFSVIIDTYTEGWIVYFNWIWLDQEISKKIQERGGDVFSLTSIVRSGLPTFLCVVFLVQIIAWATAKARWLRPRVAATLSYAFGLHAGAFAIACFLPIIGIYALNPETPDSFVSNQWHYGLSYLVLGLTIFFGIVAFVAPILLIIWSAQRREARAILKPTWARSLASIPIFFLSVFLITELGSVPSRFTSALTPIAKVDYQSMGERKFYGKAPGDLSSVTAVFLFHNKTDGLAYIDTTSSLTSITITRAGGDEVVTRNTKTRIFDEKRIEQTLLPILPGKTQLVYFDATWELDETLGDPTETFEDTWSYQGLDVIVDFNPITGANLDGDLKIEHGSPTIHPIKNKR